VENMNETERQVLKQTAETLVVASAALAQTIRGLSAIRLVLRESLPNFEKAYLSHFAGEEPEAEKARQQILAKSGELAALLQTLN